jgi:hypothetical protein
MQQHKDPSAAWAELGSLPERGKSDDSGDGAVPPGVAAAPWCSVALPAALAGLRDEIEAMLLLSSLALARAEAPLSVTGGGRRDFRPTSSL